MADVGTFLDDFFTDVGNFFTNGNYESKWDLAQAAAAEQTDQTFPLSTTGFSQFLTLLTSLNAAGPDCVALGFNQCAFSIATGANGDDVLTLTLTHPLDPGPQLSDPNDLPLGTVLSNPATLSANNTQVRPGQTISVSGTNFPVVSVSQLPIEWVNSSSGKPNGAQIKYEITGKNTATPIAVPLSALSNGLYSYTANSLAANTEYSFWARCGDQLTWSQWSNVPLKITTAATSLVNVVLRSVDDPSGSGVIVGSADLSQKSTNWTASANISVTTAEGVYNLIAELSGEGIAMTTIVVSNTLKPTLFIIDPTNGAIIPPPLFGGSPFTIKGEDFPPGVVTVTLDGTIVGMPNAPTGEFVMQLNVPGNQNSNYQTVTVTATSGSASVPLSFQTQGPPK